MPAAAPSPQIGGQELLQVIGCRIKERRRELGLTAVATAGAAGISRVTLHRIEKGTASVTVGALMNVLNALDLPLTELQEKGRSEAKEKPLGSSEASITASLLPAFVELAAYPALRQLAWHIHSNTVLTPEEAAGIYERHHRHLNQDLIGPHEQQLIKDLRQAIMGIHV